jgi:copper chaperone
MKLRVPDMSCGHCVATIERAIRAEDASARVSCDLGARTVEVEGRIGAPAVLAALAAAGYAAQPA